MRVDGTIACHSFLIIPLRDTYTCWVRTSVFRRLFSLDNMMDWNRAPTIISSRARAILANTIRSVPPYMHPYMRPTIAAGPCCRGHIATCRIAAADSRRESVSCLVHLHPQKTFSFSFFHSDNRPVIRIYVYPHTTAVVYSNSEGSERRL